MLIVKPSITFLTKNNDADLSFSVGVICMAMTGNLSYPSPTPTIASIIALRDAFDTARTNAAGGGAMLVALKNAARADLIGPVRDLANYVATACDGDLARLLSSGFPIQKPTRSRLGVLPAPAIPVVRQGKRSGGLSATTGRVSGASSYNWRAALVSAPTVYVAQVQSTGARTTIGGLVAGQTYLVEVNAVGAAGPSDYSLAAMGFMVV